MTNDNINTHKLIDDYLKGKLKGKALEDFEKKMKEDKSFANEVKFHKLIIEGIIESEDEKLLDVMKQADKEMEAPEVKKVSFLRFYRFAALILLFFAVGAYFLFLNENETDRLYTKYFTPYPNDLVTYTRGNEVPPEFASFSQQTYSKLVTGMKAYEKRDYNLAAAVFTEVISSSPEKPELIFYLAIAQIEQGEPQKAIRNLDYLTLLPDFKYKNEVKWYLAMAYLKVGNEEEALRVLESMPEDSEYNEQVTSIKRVLQSAN